MKRFVRSYYRLRYFPRLLTQMIEGGTARQTDGLRRVQESQHRAELRLADVHAEISLLCDDATRAMLASRTDVTELARRLEATQREVSQVAAQLAQLSRQLAETWPSVQAASEAGIRRHELSDERAQAAEDRAAARADALTEAGKREVQGLTEIVRVQGTAIARMERFLNQQGRLFPSNIWEPAVGERVRATLSLLSPEEVEGVGKLRVGRDFDGGYVMLDDFAGITAALSLGIADDVSWDEAIAARGIEVVQFDPSVPGPPVEHERFHFERLRVAPEDAPGTVSLARAVADRTAPGDGPDLLLKMDIEGAEWDVLAGCDEALLGRFRQILLEFHDLDRMGEEAFGARVHAVFARLARTHLVTHVHGNNCGNFAVVGNVPVPQSLEVSFAARSAYSSAKAGVPGSFPTPLDHPNQPGRADLFLGAFRFGEMAEQAEAPAR